MDPIISPGKISQHLHHIVGGSAFDKIYDPYKLRQSKCTTLGVDADKSNYWQPAVMRVLDNGTYVAMRTNTRIYYEQPELAKGAKVEPFPFDFQMVSGSPSRKTWNRWDQENISIFFFCQVKNPDGSVTREYQTHGFPGEACDMLVSKVFFPSCWNGKSFVLGGTPHVVFPKFGGGWKGPNCPKGYERRIPAILMEVYHFEANTPATKPTNKRQYILGNGDTTGYGLHADFANGWDTKVLQSMLTNCKTGPVEEPPNQACAALAPSYNREKGDQCIYEGLVPDEPVGVAKIGAIKGLPGCNKPWGWGSKLNCLRVATPKWVKAPLTAYP